MKATSAVRMVAGSGDNSYAANSKLQEKAILETRPVLHKAIEGVCTLHPGQHSTMVVADLGCSSGPNTLLILSEVISVIRTYNKNSEEPAEDLEVQFFLNDLPGNDFNLLFRSLEHFDSHIVKDTPAYYVAGLPGSFYGKLFPRESVHLFHSSYCLHWRSKVPSEISSCTRLNEGNICVGNTTPPYVIKLYQEQFQKDFDVFLTLRARELVSGGRMLLTFMGRKNEDMLMHGDGSTSFELLAKSLQTLVLKGRLEKEKLDSFNLPYYAPSRKEVNSLIKKNGLFDVENIELFESNWDPQDDSEGDLVLDSTCSGKNVAKCIRAVLEPLIIDHFGEEIIEELFMVYASMVTKHLEEAKAKYSVIMLSLKKNMQ